MDVWVYSDRIKIAQGTILMPSIKDQVDGEGKIVDIALSWHENGFSSKVTL